MSGIEALAQLFESFPGIGPRQARRFVYFLLRAEPGYRDQLIRELTTLAHGVARCTLCHRYIPKTAAREPRCAICTSTLRDTSQVMIVAKDADIEAIEQAKVYNGTYFVLGGLIKLTETSIPSALLARITERIKKDVHECIFALPVTTDGEHTRTIIAHALTSLVQEKNITLTTLGRGLSTGSELEYADPATLSSAFTRRS